MQKLYFKGQHLPTTPFKTHLFSSIDTAQTLKSVQTTFHQGLSRMAAISQANKLQAQRSQPYNKISFKLQQGLERLGLDINPVEQYYPKSKLLMQMEKQSEIKKLNMPGHCGKAEILPNLSQSLAKFGGAPLECTCSDNVGYLGNYNPPSGAYQQVLQDAKDIYGTKATYYSVNGSTGSMIAMMRVVGGPGRRGVIQRNTHRSVIHGLRIAGTHDTDISFIAPEYNEDYDIFNPVTPDALEKHLDSLEKPADFVCLTYPTYEGQASDIEAIGRMCKARKIKLVLDSSHGSLFPFDETKFPSSGIGVPGVDIVVQSLHKAAGAYSQTSLCHLNHDSSIQEEQIRLALMIEGSTSPSSILLASIEECIQMQNSAYGAKLRDQAIQMQKSCLQKLERLDFVEVLSSTTFQIDPTKITFKIKGVNGNMVREILRDRHLIDPEQSNNQSTLVAFHIGAREDVVDSLVEAIIDIKQDANNHLNNMFSTPALFKSNTALPVPKYRYTINEAFTKEWECLKVSECVGRVSASVQSPCPPGCIVLDVGEIITEEHLAYFSNPNQELYVTKDI